MYNFIVSKDDIQIVDSYKIQTTNELDTLLWEIRSNYTEKDSNTLLRSDKSLKREIRSHNLLYDLRVLRSHTKDADLDSFPKWYFTAGYFIMSCIYYMIKG